MFFQVGTGVLNSNDVYKVVAAQNNYPWEVLVYTTSSSSSTSVAARLTQEKAEAYADQLRTLFLGVGPLPPAA